MAPYDQPTPPRSLLEAQQFLLAAFQRYSALNDDPELREACKQWVTGNDRLTPAEQVDIYRRQFWLRHEDCLAEDFPALRAVLGESLWDAFVRDYLTEIPPTAPNLRDLGAQAAQFLARWRELQSDGSTERQTLRALALDAVTYELAFVDVFDGADPPPFPLAKLQALSPEQVARVRMQVNPLIKRMALSSPMHLYRKALRGGESPELPALAPCFIALFRKELVVHFEELTEPAFKLLGSLANGQTLTEACVVAAEGLDEAQQAELSAQIGGWFERWGGWGFLTDVQADG